MHLSIFSDVFAADAETPACTSHRWRAHRDGVLRGLAAIAIAAILAGLATLGDGGATTSTAREPSQAAATGRAQARGDSLYRSSSTAATFEPIKTTLERL